MKTIKFILALLSCAVSAVLWSPILYVIVTNKSINTGIMSLATFLVIVFTVIIGLVINGYVERWFDGSAKRYYHEKRTVKWLA